MINLSALLRSGYLLKNYFSIFLYWRRANLTLRFQKCSKLVIAIVCFFCKAVVLKPDIRLTMGLCNLYS